MMKNYGFPDSPRTSPDNPDVKAVLKTLKTQKIRLGELKQLFARPRELKNKINPCQ